MLEYDMLSGEFIEDQTPAPAAVEHRNWMRVPYPELRLLSVEESEAERRGRR